MIILYRLRCCEAGDVIQEKLEDLVVAHRVQVVDEESPGSVPLNLPAIQDGAEVFSGEAIQPCLARIEKRMELWSRYQSDSCYIGEDDEMC